MTIEGRPEIEHDWEKQFKRQRRERLQDSIEEYLQDDEVSPRQAYEEILSCVKDVVEYHKNNFDRSATLHSFLLGHREVDFMDDAELASKWQFDKIPGRF